jgi:hypothetical protein
VIVNAVSWHTTKAAMAYMRFFQFEVEGTTRERNSRMLSLMKPWEAG